MSEIKIIYPYIYLSIHLNPSNQDIGDFHNFRKYHPPNFVTGALLGVMSFNDIQLYQLDTIR